MFCWESADFLFPLCYYYLVWIETLYCQHMLFDWPINWLVYKEFHSKKFLFLKSVHFMNVVGHEDSGFPTQFKKKFYGTTFIKCSKLVQWIIRLEHPQVLKNSSVKKKRSTSLKTKSWLESVKIIKTCSHFIIWLLYPKVNL